MDIEEQNRKHSTCIFRSVEQVTKDIPICCGRSQKMTEFWCEAKGIFLNQPICWECNLYKAKEKS